eukprot:SAG11_NODE_21396_length_426_cov_0.477064_1_plen_21_part_10
MTLMGLADISSTLCYVLLLML